MAKKQLSASTALDPYVTTLLEKLLEGKRVISLQKGKRVFSQGDRADAARLDFILAIQVEI